MLSASVQRQISGIVRLPTSRTPSLQQRLAFSPTTLFLTSYHLASRNTSGSVLASLPVSRNSGRVRLASTRATTPEPTPKLPTKKKVSRLLRIAYTGAAGLGATVVVFGIGIVGFFLYDAWTYSDVEGPTDVNVSALALSPCRGGPKNLPIADVLIDDDQCEENRRHKDKPHLVILGSGWGSVALLKEINPEDYHVTVISPRNYFLFTPMLPSATVGTLEVRSLVESIRRLLIRIHGHYIRASADDVEFSHKLVEVSQTNNKGEKVSFYIPYDKLVIAVGSVTNPHGVEGLEHAYFLKDVNDARQIRNRILQNLELSCLPTTTDEERRRLLSFIISGGGPTGVEFAAELFDLLNEDLTRSFPKLLRNEISVHLIQSRSHILNTYDETVSRYTEERFARDQVNVMTNARVKRIFEDRILFTQKDNNGNVIEKEIPMGFCLWSTGVSQSPFSKRIAARLGKHQKNVHAIETDCHLRVNGTPLGDVYAIGDCSTVQINVAEHIMAYLWGVAERKGINPETVQLSFNDWRNVANDVRKNFPQATVHLKHLDRLFHKFDQDQSGTLDFGEMQALLRDIDSKLTSLPATAQRANQQGLYLARKLNRIARNIDTFHKNDIFEGDIDAAVYKPFEYNHLGSLAYVGNSAVFDLGRPGWNFTGGLWAVYAWRSAYFAQSVTLRTRILMAMDWAKRTLFGRDLVSFN